MATAKKRSTGGGAGQSTGKGAGNASKWRSVGIAAALLALGFIWFYHQPLTEQAVAGASYGARIGCSCRYIGGRDLSDCEKDFEPGMAVVSLSEDITDKSVTASIPLITNQTATYRKGYGCVLEEWGG